MYAKETLCTVIEHTWLTPTVFRLRFRPIKSFGFEPGQFISVLVPSTEKKGITIKRCYSLASSPFEAEKKGYYELCVKYVPGGRGTGYLAVMKEGDTFSAFAPYGDMKFKAPAAGRSLCFISTGTGIAPFRSILFSKQFHATSPENVRLIFGARTEDEVLYKRELEKLGIEMVSAVSQPTPTWTGFKGRVTDYLKSLPQSWGWHSTDFYLCGNGDMVSEVSKILEGAFNVAKTSIHKEAFSAMNTKIVTPTKENAAASLLKSFKIAS